MEDQSLNEILSEGRAVPAGGRDVSVVPLSPRQLPRFLSAIKPLQEAIGEGVDLADLKGVVLAHLVERHTEAVVQAVAVATRETPDFIGDQINVAELLELAAAVIEVNADFFARRVAPAIVAVMQRFNRLRPAGQAPSSGS